MDMDDERGRSTADPTLTGQHAYPNFAFLVHSQTSLMQDLPPKIDTAMTARQKRRRTSPEDHSILEAAYQENSKPDKTERIEIVKCVSLSEKDVQIWFQNRRQNDRRKSRPLLPHEMVPHFRNPVPQVLLDSALPGNIAPTESRRAPLSAGEIPRSAGGDEPERSSSRASSIHDLLNPPSSIESHTTTLSDALLAEKADVQDGQSLTSISLQAISSAEFHTEGGNEAAKASQDTKSPPVGVKRSHDEMVEKGTNARKEASARVPFLPSHRAHVRLSMSLDGSVKVKTNDEETPSPPKQPTPAPKLSTKPASGLQRSKSAILIGGAISEGSPGKSKIKAGGAQFGRSRDARTWEFYCDGDARDALSAHAENERTGSAVGAINLIRSQSQKARAQMMTERSDAGIVKNPTVSQRGVKPKMSRAKSSMGRLQDTGQSFVKPSLKGGNSTMVESPSGDSDKENWAPGTRSSQHRLRREHTTSDRHSILRDEDQRRRHAQSTDRAAADKRRVGVMGQPVAVDEGSIDRSSQRKTLVEEGGKGEDLDCVQGLLSLSQGAWQ